MSLTQEKAVDLHSSVTFEMAVGWKTNGFCQKKAVSVYQYMM